MILVLNQAYGSVDDMPFDIGQHRPVQYRRDESGGERETLTRSLRDAIRTIHEKLGPRRRLASAASHAQRELWRGELTALLENAKAIVAGARRWHPPFYRPTQFGLVDDPTFEYQMRDLTVRDDALSAACTEFLEAGRAFSRAWYVAIDATKDPTFGADRGRAIDMLQQGDGSILLRRIEGAFRDVADHVNRVLA